MHFEEVITNLYKHVSRLVKVFNNYRIDSGLASQFEGPACINLVSRGGRSIRILLAYKLLRVLEKYALRN